MRGGFTLTEVLVAVVLLGLVALATGGATARLASSGARDGQVMMAVDLVDERIERVQSDPSYALLEARWAGAESTLPLHPGFTRSTTITRTLQNLSGGRRLDYKTVEVVVQGPGLGAPVRRTVVVGVP